MNHREILVNSLKKAIAQGKPASHIAKESGVPPSTISKLMKGQQDDLIAGFYFSILDCLPEEIKNDAYSSLGIRQINPQQITKYLNGRDIAEIIPFLGESDKEEVVTAIAKSGVRGVFDPKQLRGEDIAKLIPFLGDRDTGEILSAIAKTLQNSRQKISV
ncbi:hypothetical protein VB713_20415 [Anabaena cylindrica UHCC 0172]|uniref:hypothetical protein n=1 Tax=Anabaena cylindrica TaxID=1165 RepID=UPI002B20220F|nr:hypothetical protein [Anabaena cylindrica]MEA5553306.1 hypothetical protein [Anabaena cylindrica UHCC 0172]